MTTNQTSATPPTILVTGATGRTGRHVVAGLLARGVRVRALVRNTLTAGLPTSVQVVKGDLNDPPSVERAARSADGAFLLWPGFSSEGAAEVVDVLARQVSHIVYLSAAELGADGADGPPEGVWADLERLIERAPVTHMFVRGGGFAANTLAWAEQIRSGDTVRMPFPQAARSLVDERDLAAVAVRGLLDPTLVGAAPSITGPQALTQAEQLDAIGGALGRVLVVREQSAEEARREYSESMGADYADAAVSHWETLVEDPEPPRDDVARLLGRPAHTFAEWVGSHVEDFETLTAAEVGQRYAAAFRAGDIAAATRMLAPDVVRVAPLETGGEEIELRGIADILANAAEDQSGNVELVSVDVGEPLVGPDSFAIRFSFEENRRDTGERQRTVKISLCTVARSRIVREEVYYYTPAHT